MITTPSILEDIPLMSPCGDAWYDSHLLLFRQAKWTSPLKAKLEAGINSNMTEGFLSQTELEAVLTNLHEQIHWFQCHGTTIGSFLSLVRYSRQRLTMKFLYERTVSELAALTQRRREGLALVVVDSAGRLQIDVENGWLSKFQVAWYGHLLLERLFENARLLPALSPAYREACMQAWFHCIQTVQSIKTVGWHEERKDLSTETATLFNRFRNFVHQIRPAASGPYHIKDNPPDDPLYAPQFYDFGLESLDWDSHEDRLSKTPLATWLVTSWLPTGEGSVSQQELIRHKALSTRDLFEGVASISEIAAITRVASEGTISDEALLEWVTRQIDTLNSASFRQFMAEACQRSWERPSQLTSTFMAICDLALNPPLPPYVCKPAQNSERWHWDEIYPPRRFLSLLKAWSNLGWIWLDSSAGTEELHNFQQRLCDHLGWSRPWEWHHPYKGLPQAPDFSIQRGHRFNHDTPIHTFIWWVESQMWAHRRKWPLLFANPIDFYTSPLASKVKMDIFSGKALYWSLPCLSWTEQKGLGSTFQDQEMRNWLAVNSLFAFSLFHLASGTGPIKLDRYPPDLWTSGHYEVYLRQRIKQRWDFDIE